MGTLQKRFFSILIVLLALFPFTTLADNAQISARLDRDEVDLDETVQLQISIHSDAGGPSIADAPEFQVPDFDIMSQRQGASIDSRYENGRFTVRKRQDFLFALRPKRAGQLKVSSIRVRQAKQWLTTPDLTVRVTAAGAAARPPRGYGGSGVGLRGAGKRPLGAEYFLRAETDQTVAYKGQQVLLSYYLYSRVNVGQPVVTKYPILNGFLREDLEIPIIQGPLENERVVLDGVPYARTLLARYATYPLQAGKSRIDSMAISLLVSDPEVGNPFGQFFDDENDPFGAGAMLSQMLKRTLPGARKATTQSEVIRLEVLPLPTEGKSPQFSGLIGDFQLSTSIDRNEVQQGVPLTLTLKVEGRGNVAAMKDPTVQWPAGVDFYEAKGKNKVDRTGLATRTIEYLIIPQTPGELELPAFELQVFDPSQKAYRPLKSDPIRISVGSSGFMGGQSESQPGKSPSRGRENSVSSVDSDAPAPLWRQAQERLRAISKKMIQGVSALVLLLLGIIAWLGGQLAWRRYKNAQGQREQLARANQLRESKTWDSLQKMAEAPVSSMPWSEVLLFYERLTGALFDLVDRKTGMTSRSLAREVLGEELVQKGHLAPELWRRLSDVFEFAETVRFAVQAGVVTEADARKKMRDWVLEGRSLEKALLE